MYHHLNPLWNVVSSHSVQYMAIKPTWLDLTIFFNFNLLLHFCVTAFLLTPFILFLSCFLSMCLFLPLSPSVILRDLNMLADSEHPQHLELHTQMKAGEEAILWSVVFVSAVLADALGIVLLLMMELVPVLFYILHSLFLSYESCDIWFLIL